VTATPRALQLARVAALAAEDKIAQDVMAIDVIGAERLPAKYAANSSPCGVTAARRASARSARVFVSTCACLRGAHAHA